jgi:quinol monooxygenase YgiN
MSTKTSPATSTANTQLTLVAFLTAKPGKGDELGSRLLTLVDRARAEGGNINYDLHRSNQNSDEWMLYENWKASGDLDSHFKLPYMKDFVSKLDEVLAGEMDLRYFSMKTKVAPPKKQS